MPLQSSENKLLQKLNGAAFLSDADINHLRDIAAKHPYFGIAHFFIAKHSLQQHSPQAEKDAQTAALHFNNTPWLKYQLQKQEHTHTETALADTLAGIDERLSIEDKLFLNEDAILHDVEENDEEINDEENAEIKSTGRDELMEETTTNNVAYQSETNEPELDDEDEPVNESEPVNDEADAAISERLGNILQQQAAEMNKPVSDDTQLPVEIQQHYRADYFASQGIKLENEPANNDQLGNKLKKFTDWLRQMKRISPNPADLGTDTTTEKLIQHIADSSNETKEIVTETMAEVLVKQQKTEHAVEIYKKLSLLHPEKETYFAAKIDEIKNLS